MSELSILLGIDTSGADGSLALARLSDDNQLTLIVGRALIGRNRSSDLVPHLDSMLAESRVRLPDIAALVVVSGPGSFTGLRIGLSAAKALSEAAVIPLIAVSRLALLEKDNENVMASALDAGRGEVYLRQTVDGISSESIVSIAALSAALQGAPIHICESALAARLTQFDVKLIPPPTAFDAILAARSTFLRHSFEDVATLDANYVRRPYAHISDPALQTI